MILIELPKPERELVPKLRLADEDYLEELFRLEVRKEPDHLEGRGLRFCASSMMTTAVRLRTPFSKEPVELVEGPTASFPLPKSAVIVFTKSSERSGSK